MSTVSPAWRRPVRRPGRGRPPLRWLARLVLLPVRLVFGWANLLLAMVGRAAGLALGLGLVLAGGLVSLTVVGAIVGIPLALLGVLLILRAIR